MTSTWAMFRDIFRSKLISNHFADSLPWLILNSLFLNMLSLVFPLVLIQVYDRVIPNKSIPTLKTLIVGLFVVLVLEFFLRVLRAAIVAWNDTCFEYNQSEAIFEKTLRIPIDRFLSEPTSTHLEKFTALQKLRSYYGVQFIEAVLDAPFVILFLLIIMYVAGSVVLVPITLIALIVIYHHLREERLFNSIIQKDEIENTRTAFLLEILNKLVDIKSLALESQFVRRYESLIKSHEDNILLSNQYEREMSIMNALFGQVAIACSAAVGCLKVINGSLSMGELAGVIILMNRCIQPALRMVMFKHNLKFIDKYEKEINELLCFDSTSQKPLMKFNINEGTIHFKSVSFKPSNIQQAVLYDVNLSVGPGNAAVILPEGDGANTLVHLLLAFYRASEGAIELDGKDISTFHNWSVRENIAYFPPKGELFLGSILDNITMFRPEHNKKAYDLISRLELDTIFDQMPEGYFTMLDNNNIHAIPKGITQRIAIARALLLNPKIIVFNQANNGVDNYVDHIINKLLREFMSEHTVLAISQDKNIIDLFKHQYVLKNGLLVRQSV